MLALGSLSERSCHQTGRNLGTFFMHVHFPRGVMDAQHMADRRGTKTSVAAEQKGVRRTMKGTPTERKPLRKTSRKCCFERQSLPTLTQTVLLIHRLLNSSRPRNPYRMSNSSRPRNSSRLSDSSRPRNSSHLRSSSNLGFFPSSHRSSLARKSSNQMLSVRFNRHVNSSSYR